MKTKSDGRRIIKISSNSKANEIAKQYKFSSKLKNSSGKTALITFKDMELLIMENDGKTNKTVEKVKYVLSDIGIWKYCRAVRKYIAKGYILEGSVSNQDEVWKNYRKKQKESVENEII
jgi:hypothetical protein